MIMMMMIRFRLCVIDIIISIELLFINLVSFMLIHKKIIFFPGPKKIEIESLKLIKMITYIQKCIKH